MAMPVMVRVETKVTQTGIMPVSWQMICTFGPVHLLKRISTRVTGETTVQRRRSLTARFTINMLFTCNSLGVFRYRYIPMFLALLSASFDDRITEHEDNHQFI